MTATARPVTSAGPGIRVLVNVVLLAGAILVALSSVIHLHLWSTGYKNIQTIGPMFLAQGVAGLVLAVAIAIFRRLLPVLAGMAFMAGTIGGLLISVHHGLFGFRDSLSSPWAETSLYIEVAGLIVLGMGAALLVWLRRRPAHG